MIAAVAAAASAAVHSLLHVGTSSTAPTPSVLGKRRACDDDDMLMSAGSTPHKEKKNGRGTKKEVLICINSYLYLYGWMCGCFFVRQRERVYIFFLRDIVPYALLPTLYCVYIIATFPLIRPTHNLVSFSCLTAPLSFYGAQASNIDIQDCLRHPRHALVRNNVHSSLHKILDGGNRVVQTSPAEKKRAEVHLHTKNFLAASKVCLSRARIPSHARTLALSRATHCTTHMCDGVTPTIDVCDTFIYTCGGGASAATVIDEG